MILAIINGPWDLYVVIVVFHESVINLLINNSEILLVWIVLLVELVVEQDLVQVLLHLTNDVGDEWRF